MRILFLLFLTCLGSLPALAGDNKGYIAKYDVYAGGIHALQARINYGQTTGKYDISISSETYGLLDKIVPWHATLETQGNFTNDERLPIEHKSDTTTRRKHEVNSFHYSANGEFKNFQQIVDGKDETRKDLDPSIYQGTTDVLTSVFSLIDQVADGKGCDRESMLFDSERSYLLIFKNGLKETLKANKYTSFSGEAIGCTFEIKPEGGKWHKKPRGWLKIQEQAKKSGQPPVIFFANVSKNETPVFVPVRMVVRADLGTFIAHLTSFEEKSNK